MPVPIVPHPPSQTLGQRLAAARQARHLNADDAARLIGVSARNLIALEEGRYDPALIVEIYLLEAKLRIYCRKLGIPLRCIEALIAEAVKASTLTHRNLSRIVPMYRHAQS